jgi:PAS domain S-box-containing protein
MTIKDIARQTGINRNSIARELAVLQATGKVDFRHFGSAKVYFPAQRVPLSAFLCFTKNLILVLDSSHNIVQINDQYLKLAQCEKGEVVGKSPMETNLPVISNPEVFSIIEGLEKEQITTDIRYPQGGNDLFFQMQVIPTTFEDGEKGSTIVFEDITERKHYVRNMEFLARTAVELIDISEGADIYAYIADRMSELIPKTLICVISFDDVTSRFTLRAIRDMELYTAAMELVGSDPIGLIFPMTEIFSHPQGGGPDHLRNWGIRKFVFWPEPGPEKMTLYELFLGQLPKEVCDRLCRTLNIGKVYYIFLVWKGQLFGSISIFLAPDKELKENHVIESFVRQASLAIARRMTEDRLRRSEQRFREMIDRTPVAVAIIDSDGRYQFLNPTFTEVFGYTLKDIPTGRDWFRLAFPDPGYRKQAIEAWKTDFAQMGPGQIRPRTYRVRCHDGEEKTVLFRPVTLSDGHQFITYEILSPGEK